MSDEDVGDSGGSSDGGGGDSGGGGSADESDGFGGAGSSDQAETSSAGDAAPGAGAPSGGSDSYFGSLNNLATSLADASYGPSVGAGSAGAAQPESIAVGEPAPDGTSGPAEPLVYYQPGGRRFFGDLGQAAASLTDEAQQIGAAGQGGGGASQTVDTPSSLGNRRFASLSDDAQRLVNMDFSTPSTPAKENVISGNDAVKLALSSMPSRGVADENVISGNDAVKLALSSVPSRSPAAENVISGNDAAKLALSSVPSRRFESLSDDAQKLVAMASTDNSAAQPDAAWKTGSAALDQGRVFAGLKDDAAKLVKEAGSLGEGNAPANQADALTEMRQALSTRRSASSAPTPAAASPASTGYDSLGQLIATLNSRRGLVVSTPTSAPRTAPPAQNSAPPSSGPYAIGGYFVPSSPTLEMGAYWRQWDRLTLADAKAKALQLAGVGVPPYLWNGSGWIPVVDNGAQVFPTQALQIESGARPVGQLLDSASAAPRTSAPPAAQTNRGLVVLGVVGAAVGITAVAGVMLLGARKNDGRSAGDQQA